MVISHERRYVFVEIPLTASWAIRQELCEHYDGVPVLHKHATYPELRRVQKVDLSDYFVFGTVRHPLDKIVSRYFKLQTDHRGGFSDVRSSEKLLTDYADREKFTFIQDTGATFCQYFRRYYRWPYGDVIDVASGRYDAVIRFEELQEGFSEVLHKLGVIQVGPIPVTNRTKGRKAEWQSYYAPDVIDQAKQVFGPYMRKWDYTFPEGWGGVTVSPIDEARFRFLSITRAIYYTRFRYRQDGFARVIRRLRSFWQ